VAAVIDGRARDTIRQLEISTPKRDRRLQVGWEGFFPYYAGYPEAFANKVLASARLKSGAVVLDPWNGSGTTTYTAARMGYAAHGFDVNPVMVIVARARLLAPSEADALRPLAAAIIGHLRVHRSITETDPLNAWFTPETAAVVRAIEEEIRRTVVGDLTVTPGGIELSRIAGTAATLYVALFTACRSLAAPFRGSNPTWLRRPKSHEAKVQVSRGQVVRRFTENVRGMAAALEASYYNTSEFNMVETQIKLADTATHDFTPNTVDFVLTSPPYCTRIDYTAATRVELAVLSPFLNSSDLDLSKKMIGSTRAPKHEIDACADWGSSANQFLRAVKSHSSKASSTYYYRTHLDYFDKMSRSLKRIGAGLRPGGVAVLVVQDSYYKEIHNDLPKILGEMGAVGQLRLIRAEPFTWRHSMSRINRHTRSYQRPSDATESVLCFTKY
jgi:hypothetical protein